MPGGRLTQQDRERIAAGLAEGHGYTEIARRLDRPTSTVSREVARNGGPGGYRADRAHQATGQRARRNGPAALLERPADAGTDADADEYGRDPEEVSAFTERFAALMVETGLPRMAARVFARLFTTDTASLTAAELVRQLRVSPASVSKAIGYLEKLELVRRERDPRRRRERYVIDDDVWFGAWSSSARSTAMWADEARRGAEILNPTTPAGVRLDHMGRFYARLSDEMTGIPVSPAAADAALTVLAALAHAGTPLTVDQLATALGWPLDRVTGALRDAEKYPDLTDPVAPVRTAAGTYTVDARPDRLNAAQRRRLGRPGPAGDGAGPPGDDAGPSGDGGGA